MKLISLTPGRTHGIYLIKDQRCRKPLPPGVREIHEHCEKVLGRTQLEAFTTEEIERSLNKRKRFLSAAEVEAVKNKSMASKDASGSANPYWL